MIIVHPVQHNFRCSVPACSNISCHFVICHSCKTKIKYLYKKRAMVKITHTHTHTIILYNNKDQTLLCDNVFSNSEFYYCLIASRALVHFCIFFTFKIFRSTYVSQENFKEKDYCKFQHIYMYNSSRQAVYSYSSRNLSC